MRLILPAFLLCYAAAATFGQTNKQAAAPTTSEYFDSAKVEEARRALQQRENQRLAGKYDTLPTALERIKELEAENSKLRDENGRLKSAVSLMQKADKLEREVIQVYQNQLAKYDPSFTPKDLPSVSVVDAEGGLGRGNAVTQTNYGQVARDFIRTVVKEPNESPEMTEVLEQLDENTIKLVDLGLMQIDPESAQIRFSSTVWSGYDSPGKINEVRMLSRFMKRHGKSGRLTIRSIENGNELASYSASTGVTLK